MITLTDFGSFHVGGRRVTLTGQPAEIIKFSGVTSFENDPNGDYQVEQAYVQYFIPADRQHELPVLLVHGGGMTGSNWETTPDGRNGWLYHFLEAGFATYVIDNTERGRAGWCALPGEWEGTPLLRSAHSNILRKTLRISALSPTYKTFAIIRSARYRKFLRNGPNISPFVRPSA